MKYGIVVVSHVRELAKATARLLKECCNLDGKVDVTYAGGVNGDGVGTTFDDVLQGIENNQGEELLVFYDLGSSKMNLSMVADTGATDKKLHIYDTALVESSYLAAVNLAAGQPLSEVEEQLKAMKVK